MIIALRRQAIMLLGIAVSICRASACAQSASGLVEGRIICNDGGTSARGASVQLIRLSSLFSGASETAVPLDSPITTSDFNGSYSLFPVEPGIYVVDVTMAGYADDLRLVLSTLNRHTPERQKSLLAALPQITVKGGGSVRQDLTLRRAGAIFGHVFVDTGGALSLSLVTATLVSGENLGGSADEVYAEPLSFSQSSLSDDRGDYRISGLPPGNYRVSVRVVENFFDPKSEGPKKMQKIGFADLTVFAPEAFVKFYAKILKVADGDEIGNVDITIPTRLLHSLTGTVTRGGRPITGITLSLAAVGDRVLSTGAVSMVDGSFRFDLLPDGEYTVAANTYNSGKAIRSTKVPVHLHGSDAVDLIIDMAISAAKQ